MRPPSAPYPPEWDWTNAQRCADIYIYLCIYIYVESICRCIYFLRVDKLSVRKTQREKDRARKREKETVGGSFQGVINSCGAWWHDAIPPLSAENSHTGAEKLQVWA